MPKRSTKNIVIPDEEFFENNDQQISFEERIEKEKKRDISDILKSLYSLRNKSYADIGEAILKKIHPLYWKVLAKGILTIKNSNQPIQTTYKNIINNIENNKFASNQDLNALNQLNNLTKSNDKNEASKLSEIYTNFCLDGRFQFQKGHMWTLTSYLPQETKRIKRAKN